jgi:hypothetical protein
MPHNLLKTFIQGFSKGLVLADSKCPQKISRTGRKYQHGVGPFTEDETVAKALEEMSKAGLAPMDKKI